MTPPAKILFGVGCEPTAAYRIGIEAQALATVYSVVVVGFRWAHFPVTDELRGENILVRRVAYDLKSDALLVGPLAFLREAVSRRRYGAIPTAIALSVVVAPILLGLNVWKSLRYAVYFVRRPHRAVPRLVRATAHCIRRISPALYVSLRSGTLRIIQRFGLMESLGAFLNVSRASLDAPPASSGRRMTSLQPERGKPLPSPQDTAAAAHRTGGNSPTFESPEARSSVSVSQALRFVIVNLIRNARLFQDWVRTSEKPHIVYVKDFDALLFGAAVKALTGAPLIYGCYEYFPHNMHGMTPLRTIAFKALEKPFARYADAIITVSPQAVDLIRKDYRHPAVHWIPNVDRESDVAGDTDAAPVAESFVPSVAGTRLKFLYQGAVAPERGVETLLRCWAEVNPDKAVLFLRIPANKYRNLCEQIAKSLGILGRSVFFLDTIKKAKEPLADSLATLQQFDAGVIPYLVTCENYRIACPRKLSHYLHSGRMILANRMDFVQQVIEKADCGLIYDAARPQTLADAVHRCADDPSLVANMKRNAKTYARERYIWENYQQDFLDIFRSVACNSESPSP